MALRLQSVGVMRGKRDARSSWLSKEKEISQGYNSFFQPFMTLPMRDDSGDLFAWANGCRSSDTLSNPMRRRIAAIPILIVAFE